MLGDTFSCAVIRREPLIPMKKPVTLTGVEDRMFICKKHLLLTMLCLLFTIVQADCLHAQQEKGTEQKAIKGKSGPSLSIKESNVQIAPASTPAGQTETQKSGKNASGGGAQPHITIAAPDYDAGETWENEDIINTFIVKNTGTAPLDISNVKPG